MTNCATVWYNGCSAADRKSLQWVVKTAQRIVGVQLPAIKDLQHKHFLRRAHCIIRDLTTEPQTVCPLAIKQTLHVSLFPHQQA